MGLEQPRYFQAPVQGLAQGGAASFSLCGTCQGSGWPISHRATHDSSHLGWQGCLPERTDAAWVALPISQSPCVALGRRCCPCKDRAPERTHLPPPPTPEMSWRGKRVCAISLAFSLHRYIGTKPGLADCRAPQAMLASSPGQPLPPLPAPPLPVGRCGGAGGLGKGAGQTGLAQRKVSPIFSWLCPLLPGQLRRLSVPSRQVALD